MATGDHYIAQWNWGKKHRKICEFLSPYNPLINLCNNSIATLVVIYAPQESNDDICAHQQFLQSRTYSPTLRIMLRKVVEWLPSIYNTYTCNTKASTNAEKQIYTPVDKLYWKKNWKHCFLISSAPPSISKCHPMPASMQCIMFVTIGKEWAAQQWNFLFVCVRRDIAVSCKTLCFLVICFLRLPTGTNFF